MFNPSDTFPYIGLRPFSEEDSLYFKGRDEQILQLTAQLEANKFLMVTGASGDGKSSLVYAGLVPNARAGFFKARYANWVVADFRPERTPLHNLSKSISRNLRIGNEASVEVELRRGFSSLLEVYTNSSLYVDEQSENWKAASESERDDMQRKAANLLIVADQFEEFFTNPENYYKNAPSADSQLVINLLLETAKISISKNLPVYIVCTMRSDYIGQCAAFRGLPEFIGFSQFFVPRLKRKEMVQVVKEPAALHGDKISNRLTERVVYDLGEGIDQLPVLEHAMNEVWIQAKNGAEELDLLHYAMAGGMPVNELPPDDLQKFNEWFGTLPAKLQEAYQHPGLSHIIDTHANKLYLSAADQYNQSRRQDGSKPSDALSTADAQLIIKTAFTCLTKMDEGRAVRNRMTLQEITDILAKPELTCEVVGGVLNIFREPGNTFLRPYITDDPDSQKLKPESVLDITHESLIRNWELLLTWAKEEFDHLTVYEDFKKQLDRWVASQKSNGFLLSIGPLTYFEAWYEKLNPNIFWVNRYLDPGLPISTRLAEARSTIDHAQEFLKRSANKHRITRMVVRHGATKLASIAAAIFIFILCIYYYLDGRKKENDYVINQVLSEGEVLVRDPRVIGSNKAEFLLLSEFIQPGSFKRIVDGLPDEEKFGVAKDAYTEFAWNANASNPPIRKEILLYMDSVLRATPDSLVDKATLNTRLYAWNMLIIQTTHHLFFYKDQQLQKKMNEAVVDLRKLVMDILVSGKYSELPDTKAINEGLEHLLNNNALSVADVEQILKSISPFEGEPGVSQFKKIFPVTGRVNYSRGNQYVHSGGYQELAYLYAVVGKTERIKSCIDSLIKYNPNYPRYRNGAINIAAYLFLYQHNDELRNLISDYCNKQGMRTDEFFERWVNMSGIYSIDFSNKLWVAENHNIVLERINGVQMKRIFDMFEAELRKNSTDQTELHFNLSLYYKQRGAIFSKMSRDGHADVTTAQLDSLFLKSVEEYRKVPPDYLDQEITVFKQNRQQGSIKRKKLFLYPDHYQKVWNRAFFVPKYYSIDYLNYLVKNDLIDELYQNEEDVRLIYTWLKNYMFVNGTSDTQQEEKNYTPLLEEDLALVESLFTEFSAKIKLNGMGNLSRLLLIQSYLEQGQYDKFEPLYQKLEIDQFDSNLKEPEYNTQGLQYPINSFSNLMNVVVEYLASQGRQAEANRIISEYTSITNRIKAYSDVQRGFQKFPSPAPEVIFSFLDSAVTETKRLADYQFTSSDPRIVMAYAMSATGGKKLNDLSQTYVKQLSLNAQSDIIQRWIQGIAASGDYYQAYTAIPEISILTDRLYLYSMILVHDAVDRSKDPNWKLFLKKKEEGFYQEDFAYEINIF
jgi:energy-coupling factor transporter ATP-binding protein EcfA2